jgi:RNA polymerase sigma-70 factor (ECF subfamily)
MSSAGAAYADALEPHRRALHAHCYRMLGSVQDAEDAVQEALLKAWRALDGFEGRASLRSWLYTIATNVCLRMLERRPGRLLPLDYGPPMDPHESLGPPLPEPTWIEPYPSGGPEATYEQLEAVELAFIAALQRLPARQRAALILSEVLGFSGSEVAGALETSPDSVYSLLQRARATLASRLPQRSQQATLRALGDARLASIVDRYVDAWARADVAAIVELLTEDATLAMPPTPAWVSGRDAVAIGLRLWPLSGLQQWRLVPTRANGQLAAGVFLRAPSGTFVPYGLTVLTLDGDRIAAITTYHDTAAPERFGLPAYLGGSELA